MTAPDHPVSPEHMITMLSESELFHSKGFNPVRLLALRDTLEFVALQAGEVLYSEGDPIDSFFILVYGELNQQRSTGSGGQSIKRADFDSHPPVGIKTLREENRVSTVSATAPSGLVRISKDSFMDASCMGLDRNALRRSIMQRLLEGELKKILIPMFGLSNVGMFNDLSKQLEWIELARGQHLFDQNHETDSFYILLSGRLQVIVQPDDHENSKQVSEITPGTTVGEMEVVTGESRSSTVIALRDSDLVRFSSDDFNDLTVRYPQLWPHLTQVMIKRLKMAYRESDRKTICSNILVISATNDPLSDFTDHIRNVLAESQFQNRSCLVLTSQDVDQQFAIPGIAQSTRGAPHELRLRIWLSEQEQKHDIVLLVADSEVTEWTSRCIRRADEVMYVAAAGTKPETGRVAQEFQNQEEAHQASRRKSLVLLHPEDADRPRGTAAWLDEFGLRNSTGSPQLPGRHFHIRKGLNRDFERLARFVTRQEVGLVLSGGGARGFAHVGCIRAMREQGIPIDMVGGVSMGSLVSAALASDPDNFEQTIDRIKSRIPKALTDLTFPAVSIYRGRRFDTRLKSWFGEVQIEDLWLPYFCVTSNLTHANIYVHDAGPLWWAVRASGTLPGLTTPVVHDGQILLDGCLLDNLPTDVMRERMYESHVIAVDVVPPKDLPVDVSNSIQSPSGLSLFLNKAANWLASKLNLKKKRYELPNIFSILQRAGELGSVYGRERQKALKLADLDMLPKVDDIRIADFKELGRSEKIGYEQCGKEVAEWWAEVQSGQSR